MEIMIVVEMGFVIRYSRYKVILTAVIDTLVHIFHNLFRRIYDFKTDITLKNNNFNLNYL